MALGRKKSVVSSQSLLGKNVGVKLLSLVVVLLVLPAVMLAALSNQDIRQQASVESNAALITLSPASATFIPRQAGRIEVLLDTQFEEIDRIQMGIDITGTVPSDLQFGPAQPSGWLVSSNTLTSTQAGLRLTLVLEPNPNQDTAMYSTRGTAVPIGTFSFTGADSERMNFVFDRNFTQVWQARTGENILTPPIDYHYSFDQTIGSRPATLSLVKSTAIIPSRNSIFQLDLRANTGGQTVERVVGALEFDPRYLKVREIQENTSLFSYPQKEFDNGAGMMQITAEAPSVAGENVLVARIVVEALAESSSTQVRLVFDPQSGLDSSAVVLAGSDATQDSRDILGRVQSFSTAIDPENNKVVTFGARQIGVWEIVGVGFLVIVALLGLGIALGYRRRTEYQHWPK